LERIAPGGKVKENLNGHDRRHAARSEEIVTAATEVFFEKGYGRTSMDDIIAKVGGSKRTLYSHFPGKEALFAAVVRKISGEALSAFQPKLEGDFESTLREMALHYLEILLKPQTISLFRAMVSEAPHFPELAKTFFENGPNRVAAHFSEFFRTHNARGIYRIADPDLVARQFLGMIRDHLHLAAVITAKNPTRKELTQTIDNAMQTLMNCSVERVAPVVKNRR
jgi:TetR/AcrR family transcriptional regulator, mexJK operon transcriptional repressor